VGVQRPRLGCAQVLAQEPAEHAPVGVEVVRHLQRHAVGGVVDVGARRAGHALEHGAVDALQPRQREEPAGHP
jgi:hypothetical protein